MASQIIFECQAFLPTLERARRKVPPEFLVCYDWFQDHENSVIDKLPHHMHPRPRTPIPLSRDAGIHTPGNVAYKRKYALSVHTGRSGKYADREPIRLEDGTWIIDYAAHEGKDTNQRYNSNLMNCLEDGIPVGVIVGEKSGYRVYGLAFVERYNSATKMFTLHGPVNSRTESEGAFAMPGYEDMPRNERRLVEGLDDSDERKLVFAERVRRERQGRFRRLLFEAYGGRCAITGTDIPEVLQAAHINPYRGKKSQVASNGLLLRSDLHLLYDAHLISVRPDSHHLVLSSRLAGSPYEQLDNEVIRVPKDPFMQPSEKLLQIHYEQFRRENESFVA